MAKEDWAIVVGLNHYPAMAGAELEGPENDARAFHEWLTTEGEVPKEHVTLILSSDFKRPGMAAPPPMPGIKQVEKAFSKLYDLSQSNVKAGEGHQLGRRLYIYLAGHGFAPNHGEVALLTADGSLKRRGNHIPGRAFADWFHFAGYFQEVLLFMDCCRDNLGLMQPRPLPFPQRTDRDAVRNPEPFCVYATPFSRKSREKHIKEHKQVRGVLSTALLAGLDGGAADPQGQITTRSLTNYLYNNMKYLIPEADRDHLEYWPEPDIDADDNPNIEILIARVPLPIRFPVRLLFKPEHRGKKVQVLDSKLKVVESNRSAGKQWRILLPPGVYLAEIPGTNKAKPIQVNGHGAPDVAF